MMRWYLALGLCFGLGMLGKWNFVMFAVALPLACLVHPAYRGLILNLADRAGGAADGSHRAAAGAVGAACGAGSR